MKEEFVPGIPLLGFNSGKAEKCIEDYLHAVVS